MFNVALVSFRSNENMSIPDATRVPWPGRPYSVKRHGVTIAVVILSTSVNPRNVDYCYANGANPYHVKPARYDQHLERLRELLAYWLGDAVLPAPAEVSA